VENRVDPGPVGKRRPGDSRVGWPAAGGGYGGPKLGVDNNTAPEGIKVALDVDHEDVSRGSAAVGSVAAASTHPRIQVAAVLELGRGERGSAEGVGQQAPELGWEHRCEAFGGVSEESGHLDSRVEERVQAFTGGGTGDDVGGRGKAPLGAPQGKRGVPCTLTGPPGRRGKADRKVGKSVRDGNVGSIPPGNGDMIERRR